jgi:hypothetical protein
MNAMSDVIDSKKISRRSIVAGITALGLNGLARNARAARTACGGMRRIENQ